MSSKPPAPPESDNGFAETLQSLTALTGLTEADYAVLRTYDEQTEAWMKEVFDDFYDAILGYDQTAGFFPGGNHAAHERYLHRWYLQAVSGDFSPTFWQAQWVVGLVHIRKHVSNPYMFGAMSRIQQMFLHKCLQNLSLSEAEKLFGAFKRVTDVIAGLVAEAYFLNYVGALENVMGFRKSLVEQMMSLEINKRLAAARAQARPPATDN